MGKRRCFKWKTISVYDEFSHKLISYELDENEKLIKKDVKHKKIPLINKFISLNHGQVDCAMNIFHQQKPKIEVLNQSIFSSLKYDSKRYLLEDILKESNKFEIEDNKRRVNFEFDVNEDFEVTNLSQYEFNIENEFKSWRL